ncbi:hypothetical protein ACFO1B_17095 [Dactylosporangium siamense]|uniref:Uncharacterized protein n=1 Tax=Dactylosporangium siamense TaxID=685454 RepID=A0A919PL47_9ACTN|nr:hypothetical protein [Dactylosporangium siamense]GIG45557.1 hypothetical protein Dsi01nite_035980 [Dactylosporangium siamense]
MFDDLVWESVCLLDAHDDDRLRDLLPALFAFQRQHDGSMTHFRGIELLVRRRFVYRFPLDQHPDYPRRRAYFDALTQYTALRTFDEDAEDFDGYDTELEDGYVDPPLLYCDAGTDLWRRMVDAGRLTGSDAVAPRPVALIDAVLAVAAAAERAGDRELIALWYTLGSGILVGLGVGVEELRAIPAVQELREIALRTDALSVPVPPGRRPSDEEVEAMGDECESWWYGLSGTTTTR